MNLILLVTGYVVGHFGAYAIELRHLPKFRQEAGIFAYHAISYFFLLGLMVAAGATWGMPGWIATLFAAGLHGIYSLSFLELWSLTQGSYSLGILAHIAQAGGQATSGQLAALQSVGTGKQNARQADLHRLRLILPEGKLTFPGRVVTIALRAIFCLSNGRPLN